MFSFLFLSFFSFPHHFPYLVVSVATVSGMTSAPFSAPLPSHFSCFFLQFLLLPSFLFILFYFCFLKCHQPSSPPARSPTSCRRRDHRLVAADKPLLVGDPFLYSLIPSFSHHTHFSLLLLLLLFFLI